MALELASFRRGEQTPVSEVEGEAKRLDSRVIGARLRPDTLGQQAVRGVRGRFAEREGGWATVDGETRGSEDGRDEVRLRVLRGVSRRSGRDEAKSDELAAEDYDGSDDDEQYYAERDACESITGYSSFGSFMRGLAEDWRDFPDRWPWL